MEAVKTGDISKKLGLFANDESKASSEFVKLRRRIG